MRFITSAEMPRRRSLLGRLALATTLGLSIALGIAAGRTTNSASGGPGTVKIHVITDSASGGPGNVYYMPTDSASGGPGNI